MVHFAHWIGHPPQPDSCERVIVHGSTNEALRNRFSSEIKSDAYSALRDSPDLAGLEEFLKYSASLSARKAISETEHEPK